MLFKQKNIMVQTSAPRIQSIQHILLTKFSVTQALILKYSCELYERAIRSHKLQKNNAKGLEKTYAERENIRHFLQVYQQKNGPLRRYDDGRGTFKFDEGILGRNDPFYLHENSIAAASSLIRHSSNLESPKLCHAIKNGVAVGKIKCKLFDDYQVADIERYLKYEDPTMNIEMPTFIQSLTSVIIQDQFGMVVKLTKGDTCVVSGGDNDEENGSWKSVT